MIGPIDTGFYLTRSGRRVEIFETGCFAYGRVLGGGPEDLWTLDTGEYDVSDKSFPDGHPLDLVKRIGDRRGLPCPICGKEKGQPPRCNGHYAGTASDPADKGRL